MAHNSRIRSSNRLSIGTAPEVLVGSHSVEGWFDTIHTVYVPFVIPYPVCHPVRVGAGGESHLQGEKREQLMQLAAQVAAEQDPKKFRALLVELNELLQEKDQRLQTQGQASEKPPSR